MLNITITLKEIEELVNAKNEGTISREDIKSADIDVLARTILRLTRAVGRIKFLRK